LQHPNKVELPIISAGQERQHHSIGTTLTQHRQVSMGTQELVLSAAAILLLLQEWEARAGVLQVYK
jgi:hypothetical protein